MKLAGLLPVRLRSRRHPTQKQLGRWQAPARILLKAAAIQPADPGRQVAVVYAVFKGLIDEVPVELCSQFVRELRSYLKSMLGVHRQISADKQMNGTRSGGRC